jgi:hypothetical protein
LADAGLYKSHTSARPRCHFALNYKDDDHKLHSDLVMAVTVDVCAKAPSKKPVLGDNRIPRDWFIQVIDRLSRPCKHVDGEHNDSEEDPWMGLHLVRDCYDDLPMFALGSRELAELSVSAKKEASRFCCDPVDEALKDRNFVNR